MLITMNKSNGSVTDLKQSFVVDPQARVQSNWPLRLKNVINSRVYSCIITQSGRPVLGSRYSSIRIPTNE